MEPQLLPVLRKPLLQLCRMSMTTAVGSFPLRYLQPSPTIRPAAVLSSTPTRIPVVTAQPKIGRSSWPERLQHGLFLRAETQLVPAAWDALRPLGLTFLAIASGLLPASIALHAD